MLYRIIMTSRMGNEEWRMEGNGEKSTSQILSETNMPNGPTSKMDSDLYS